MDDISNQSAISYGNSRIDAVRDLNERIRQHNSDVSDAITNAQQQLKTADTIRQAQDTAKGLWTASKLPEAIEQYKAYKVAQTASNPTSQFENMSSLKNKLFGKIATDAQGAETLPTTPPAEPVAEGAATGASISEDAESTGSKLANGLGGLKSVATQQGETLLSKAAKGAGVLGAGAIGAMDVYDDFKGGLHLNGNNWEEKAGNFLQIGGSIADIVGTVYPPAKLIGGVLDLTSGALDQVGQHLDTKTSQQLQQQGQKQMEQQVQLPTVVQTGSAGVA